MTHLTPEYPDFADLHDEVTCDGCGRTTTELHAANLTYPGGAALLEEYRPMAAEPCVPDGPLSAEAAEDLRFAQQLAGTVERVMSCAACAGLPNDEWHCQPRAGEGAASSGG